MNSLKLSLRTSRALAAALLLVAASILVTSAVAARTPPATAPAAQAQPVVVELTGEVVRGGEVVKFTDDFSPKPGEVITWRVRLNNRKQTAISNVKAIGPVPAGTVYVADSAQGEGVTVDYSLDGENFSPRPMVRNGRGELVPADPSAYKSVRLTFNESVAPGASKGASYRTRVR